MKIITITRNSETEFSVVSGPNTYTVSRATGKWNCDCPARGMCKHLLTVLSSFGLAIGSHMEVNSITDSSLDDGLLSPEEFDMDELEYVRSGREKRNYGC